MYCRCLMRLLLEMMMTMVMVQNRQEKYARFLPNVYPKMCAKRIRHRLKSIRWDSKTTMKHLHTHTAQIHWTSEMVMCCCCCYRYFWKAGITRYWKTRRKIENRTTCLPVRSRTHFQIAERKITWNQIEVRSKEKKNVAVNEKER